MAAKEERLTPKEAALYCNFKSLKPLRTAVRRRELQQIIIGYRTKFFEKSELDRWLNSKKTKVIRACSTSILRRQPSYSESSSAGSHGRSTVFSELGET
jgi:hypothetical protein